MYNQRQIWFGNGCEAGGSVQSVQVVYGKCTERHVVLNIRGKYYSEVIASGNASGEHSTEQKTGFPQRYY